MAQDITLTTPQPITTATPELSFDYDFGHWDDAYPVYGFIDCRKDDNSYVQYDGGPSASPTWTVGDPGRLGQSGTWTIQFASTNPPTGSYTAKIFNQNHDPIAKVKFTVS